MFAMIKTALATVLIAGSATLALADDGTDSRLDTSRTGFAQETQFTSGQVSLAQDQFTSRAVSPPQGQTMYIDRAGANHDNGGN